MEGKAGHGSSEDRSLPRHCLTCGVNAQGAVPRQGSLWQVRHPAVPWPGQPREVQVAEPMHNPLPATVATSATSSSGSDEVAGEGTDWQRRMGHPVPLLTKSFSAEVTLRWAFTRGTKSSRMCPLREICPHTSSPDPLVTLCQSFFPSP